MVVIIIKFLNHNNHTLNIISPLRATLRGGAVLMAGRLLARESRHPPWSKTMMIMMMIMTMMMIVIMTLMIMMMIMAMMMIVTLFQSERNLCKCERVDHI